MLIGSKQLLDRDLNDRMTERQKTTDLECYNVLCPYFLKLASSYLSDGLRMLRISLHKM